MKSHTLRSMLSADEDFVPAWRKLVPFIRVPGVSVKSREAAHRELRRRRKQERLSRKTNRSR